MKKVYKSCYKTESVYAEGYIVLNEDDTIEGIFAFDYLFIYKEDNKYIACLNAKSVVVRNSFCSQVSKLSEYFADVRPIYPNKQYLFFNYSADGLCLEVLNEVFDNDKISEVCMDIQKARTNF